MNLHEMVLKYEKKKVLVTGGLGFLGSNIARKLVSLRADVLVVDSMISDYGGNLFNVCDVNDKIKINFSDMRDMYSMNYLVRNQDYIFNLAGQISHVDSMIDPHTDLDINCKSQLTLLEACRKNNPDAKIIYAGTRGQYGKVNGLVDENHPMIPADVNGINKLAGELFHMLYYDAYGIKTTSLRLTNTYGPGLRMIDCRQGFIGWFIRKAIDDEKIEVFGDGNYLRDFNYVDDVVDAFLLAMISQNTDGVVFNVGSGNPVSVKKIAEKIIELAGSGHLEFIEYPVDRKKIEIGDYVADITKIKNVLKWEPKVTLEDGLAKTIAYYKKYKNHYW